MRALPSLPSYPPSWPSMTVAARISKRSFPRPVLPSSSDCLLPLNCHHHRYKSALVDSSAADIVYSNLFTGVHGNYLRSSIISAGLDPDNLPDGDVSTMKFGSDGSSAKAWRDVWGCGQGIGAIKAVQSTRGTVQQLAAEYEDALRALGQASAAFRK